MTDRTGNSPASHDRAALHDSAASHDSAGARPAALLDALLESLSDRELSKLGQRLDPGESGGSAAEGTAAEVTLQGRLAMVAQTARAYIGQLCPLSDLLAQMPSLTETVPTVQRPLWQVLAAIDNSYQIDGDWCAAPTIEAARQRTTEALRAAADREGSSGRLADLDLIEADTPAQKLKFTADWLAWCGITVTADRYLLTPDESGEEGEETAEEDSAEVTEAEPAETAQDGLDPEDVALAAKVPKLFRRADAWVYRITVTKSDRRGGSRPIPYPLARILGLELGAETKLDSIVGPVALQWTEFEASIASIRQLLFRHRILIGSEVFLVFTDSGSLRIERVAPLTQDPMAAALALIGAPRDVDEDAAWDHLAAALGLPADEPIPNIVDGYADRRDTDIVKLLQAHLA